MVFGFIIIGGEGTELIPSQSFVVSVYDGAIKYVLGRAHGIQDDSEGGKEGEEGRPHDAKPDSPVPRGRGGPCRVQVP